MSGYSVKAVRVQVFELFNAEGGSLGLFRLHSTWHGMQELKSIDGKAVLIVDGVRTHDNIFGNVFEDIFGGILGAKDQDAYPVVKASPDLVAKLTSR